MTLCLIFICLSNIYIYVYLDLIKPSFSDFFKYENRALLSVGIL